MRVSEQLNDGAAIINTQFKLLIDKLYLTCSDAAPPELAAAIQQPLVTAGVCVLM